MRTVDVKHFGHNKGPGRSGSALAATGSQGNGTPSRGQSRGAGQMPLYMPPLETFFPVLADVYNSAAKPVGAVTPNISGVNALITGTWSEGTRNRVAASNSYTHIAIVDPSIAVQDPYAGQGGTPPSGTSWIGMPSGGPASAVSEWWKLVMTEVVVLPSLGKRKLLFLDRQSQPTDWGSAI
jgi:hypothetical protein